VKEYPSYKWAVFSSDEQHKLRPVSVNSHSSLFLLLIFIFLLLLLLLLACIRP
jgi:membrane-associated protease RseP (regulator of RpoE activity)